MSFQDAINRILHVLPYGNGNTKVPYITLSGRISKITDELRSDYDETRQENGRYYNHGGVDIIYGEMVNGQLQYRGATDPINQNVSVYSPVEGAAWNVTGTGTVIIKDRYGYFHIIRHMDNINDSLSEDPNNPTLITSANINTFSLGIMSNTDLDWINGKPPAIHVHYEITTFYKRTPERYEKIDPEAFWNYYPADPQNGFYALIGTSKKENKFYGTENNEIIKGEGIGDVLQNINRRPQYFL